MQIKPGSDSAGSHRFLFEVSAVCQTGGAVVWEVLQAGDSESQNQHAHMRVGHYHIIQYFDVTKSNRHRPRPTTEPTSPDNINPKKATKRLTRHLRHFNVGMLEPDSF